MEPASALAHLSKRRDRMVTDGDLPGSWPSKVVIYCVYSVR